MRTSLKREKAGAQETVKTRKRISGFGLTMIAIAFVCFICLIILKLLIDNNIRLIMGELYYYIATAGVAALALWGIYAICERVKKRSKRMLVGLGLGSVLAVLITFFVSYVQTYMPVYYGTKLVVTESETGNRAVIIKGYYIDADRIVRRLEEKGDGGEVTAEDLMYQYKLYPVINALFMDTSGETDDTIWIHIGYDSTAKLMQEWSNDGKTLRLFIQDPVEDDFGEITLDFLN